VSWLTNNFVLKIFALISAALLWIFVINKGFRVDFLEKEIPVQVYNLSEDLAVVSDAGKVKLKIRAPSSLWPKISEENIEAYVDLKNFEKGTYDVEVKISTANPKIQILGKDPAKVSITIEPLALVKKEITIETSGSLGEGYALKEPASEVKKVEVSGAKSVLESIAKVVAKIELRGETEELKQSVKLEALDSGGNLISNVIINPETVDITIPVQKEVDVKTVGIRANVIGSPATGFLLEKIETEPSTITIRGRAEKLKTVEYLETKEINITGITSNKEEKATVVVPLDITLVDSQEVLVKISVTTTKITKSVEAGVIFKNLDNKFEVKSYTPSVVSLTIEGNQNAINSLQQNEIQVNLDLIGKGSGTYNLEITPGMIRLPEGINLKSIDTKEVKIVVVEK
jgi:YbbR domain-containing protein